MLQEPHRVSNTQIKTQEHININSKKTKFIAMFILRIDIVVCVKTLDGEIQIRSTL